MYEFHYFNSESEAIEPETIKALPYTNDLEAFIALDYEQEYLNQSHSVYSVLLIKDGQNMADKFLAWASGEDVG